MWQVRATENRMLPAATACRLKATGGGVANEKSKVTRPHQQGFMRAQKDKRAELDGFGNLRSRNGRGLSMTGGESSQGGHYKNTWAHSRKKGNRAKQKNQGHAKLRYLICRWFGNKSQPGKLAEGHEQEDEKLGGGK